MAKHVYGLAKFEMGAIAVDGDMGTTLTQFGETVAGTANMTTDENQVTDFNIEESDSPVESILTKAGTVKHTFSTYNVDADTMVAYFGGTKTAGPPVKYDFPDSFPDIEMSCKITDKKGNVIQIPRAKITAKMSMSFAKDKLGQVDVTVTVLQPTKTGVKRMTITYA